MLLSEKQLEYIRSANRRWNIKCGAVRSGKTYADYFMIPIRLKKAVDGAIVLIGMTRGTLERNILDPMRQIWGSELVGFINGDGMVQLFGKDCYTIGAASADAASKLQGSSIGYCYGDEITTWNEKVFRMLQSRLDKPSSVFDGSCNPAHPSHWFKKFLDSDADIYRQDYLIDDNPFLPADFVTALKREYEGTVFYDRYILGKWTAAEGIIYRLYANCPERYRASKDDLSGFDRVICGLDFGGNKSKSALVCIGVKNTSDGTMVTTLMSRLESVCHPAALTDWVAGFLYELRQKYGILPDSIFCDNAEPVLLRGLIHDIGRIEELSSVSIRGAKKSAVSSRIAMTSALLSRDMLKISDDSKTLSEALSSAMWDSDGERRLDDFSTDIDTLDAFEYALERVRI